MAPETNPMNVSDFTLDQKRAFVLRHVEHMASIQNPTLADQYQKYVAEAPESWIDQSFTNFAELYNFNRTAILELCAP